MKMTELMMSDSPYLCKEMIWDTPVVVTIDRVEGNHKVHVPNSARTEVRKVIFFVSKKLGLVLNAGHKKFLKRVLGGNDTREWKGRKILLYVEPTATYSNQTVGGIRMAVKTGQGVQWSGTEPKGTGPPRDAPVPPLVAAGPKPPTKPPQDDADDYDRSA